MTRFIVFATLLAVQFANGASGHDEVSRRDRDTREIFDDWGNAGGKYSAESSAEQKVFDLLRGSTKELTPVTSNTTFCQLTDPNGVQMPMIIGRCQHTISVVSPRHEGIWTGVYGTEGSLPPRNLSFIVTTRDPQTMESIVDYSKPNEIQLACRVNISEPREFGFCHFTRPDGHVLSLSPGAATDGYKTSAMLNPGMESKEFFCGMIISPPKAQDYGAWRCRITDRNGTTYGTVLQVKRNNVTGSRNVKVVAQNVYVRQSDAYQIKCTADAALSYCWFRSPNGTAYSVSASKTRTPFSLPYVGAGLPLGDCAAQIENASFADRGEWTCNVGVVNGSEKRRSFDVHVAESYVIPERPRLMAAGPGNIILSCNILPNATDRAVHYCRWIRPDGYGIHNDASPRYTTHTGNTRCELIIRGGASIEDLGNWTCVGGLSSANSFIEESQATITVSIALTTFQSLLGVSVALTTMLMIIVCMLSLVHLRRRLRILPANPPPYTLEPPSQPRFMKAECNSKEFRY